MTWLDEFDLTAARADIAQMLPDTCVIQSKTRVSDGRGGGTVTWAAVTGGTVACRIDPMGRSLAMVEMFASQETQIIRYKLTVPYDTPIAVDRRAVINGITYEIVQMDFDHSKRVARRAIVTEVRT